MNYDVVSLIPMLCDVFIGEAQIEGGLAFPEEIEREQLDFSLQSLHALDRYLDFLHAHEAEIEEQEHTNTVLAAGAYLGEVIRELATVDYRWVNYADYFPNHPRLEQMVPEMAGTSAVLVSEYGVMTMPLNKIARYIGDGPENNTHFYAEAELASAKRQLAGEDS